MTDTNRGSLGRTPRIRNLNVESQQDFVRGFREWFLTDMEKVVSAHAEQLVRQNSNIYLPTGF